MSDEAVVYIPGYGQSKKDEDEDTYPLRSIKLDVYNEKICIDKHATSNLNISSSDIFTN